MTAGARTQPGPRVLSRRLPVALGPQIPQLPSRPGHSSARRDTMLLNNESRAVQDPDHDGRAAMEGMFGLA